MTDNYISGAERRNTDRKHLILKVSYQDSSEYLTSWTENISDGGFFFQTESSFQIGQSITVELSFPGLLKSFEINGKVAWTREPGPGTPAGIGVRVDSDSGKRLLARVALKADHETKQDPSSTYRILVVEDNEYSQKACERVLNHLKEHSPDLLEVHFCPNGHEALCIAEESEINLIITDVFMPVLDGIGFVRKLRHEAKLDIPVIVVTAGGDEERRAMEELGIDAFLEKPIQFGQLFETIIYLIHLNESAA